MTLSLTWKVSSCVFLFLLVSFFPPSHYYFPLLSLSFPILVPFLLLFFDFPAELSVFLRCLPISSLFCAICVSELCFQFYSSPSEPFGGHREQLGSRPALAIPGGSRAALSPCGRCSMAAAWLSVLSVPWFCALVSLGGCALVCLQCRERETGAAAADPPLKEPFKHLCIQGGKSNFPAVAGACSRSTGSRGHPRSPRSASSHGDFAG